jgi:hypothetical protein
MHYGEISPKDSKAQKKANLFSLKKVLLFSMVSGLVKILRDRKHTESSVKYD